MVPAALHRWQVGCKITIGPFGELNYETATNVNLITIHSFRQILNNFYLFRHIAAYQVDLLYSDGAFNIFVRQFALHWKTEELLSNAEYHSRY